MKEPGIEDILSENGPVEELELDDEFQEHLRERATYGKHRVSLAEILQVRLLRPKLFLNSSPSGRAPLIIVGPTREERWLCILLSLPVSGASGDRSQPLKPTHTTGRDIREDSYAE